MKLRAAVIGCLLVQLVGLLLTDLLSEGRGGWAVLIMAIGLRGAILGMMPAILLRKRSLLFWGIAIGWIFDAATSTMSTLVGPIWNTRGFDSALLEMAFPPILINVRFIPSGSALTFGQVLAGSHAVWMFVLATVWLRLWPDRPAVPRVLIAAVVGAIVAGGMVSLSAHATVMSRHFGDLKPHWPDPIAAILIIASMPAGLSAAVFAAHLRRRGASPIVR